MKRKKNIKKKKINNNKNIFGIMIIAFIFVAVLSLLLLNINSFDNNKFDTSLIVSDSNKSIIYENNDNYIYPVINLSSNDVNRINKEIKELFKDKNTEYTYSVNSDTLSIIITDRLILDNSLYVNYKTYNIDLNTLNELSDEDILDKFDINRDTLNVFVSSKFENYYVELLKNKIISEKECNFDCFIDNCNFQNYLEDNNYSIEDNHLILYKFFDTNGYSYNNYFDESNFRFVVK